MQASKPGVVVTVALATGVASLLVVTSAADGSARSRSYLTTTWSASKVVLGTPATVRGRVTSRQLQSRTVSLYVYLKSGWRRVGATHSSARGVYSIKVPTDYYFSRPMQLRSPATTRAKAVTSRHHTFTVAPAYVPAGSRWSWARVVPRAEVRVNPCRVVTYRVNVGSPPTGYASVADLQTALRRITEATGIRFRNLGPTTAFPRPRGLAPTPWPSDSNLVIAWATPEQTFLELGGPAGYEIYSQSAVLSYRAAHDGGGPVRRIAHAAVVLDATQDLGSGFEQKRGRILMHEVAGALGLGSVSASTQKMSEVIPETVPLTATGWGAGDLTGLKRVGLVEGCVTDNR